MRLAPFGPARRLGALLDGGHIVDLNLAYAGLSRAERAEPLPYAAADLNLPASLDEFLRAGRRAIESARWVLERASERGGLVGPAGERTVFGLGEVKVEPPLPSESSRIFCAGANFASHQLGVLKRRGEEKTIEVLEKEIRAKPFWGFYKLPHTIVGSGETVRIPRFVGFFDYELELAAYIGRAGRNVGVEEARDMIVGYSCFVDWSMRDRSVIIGSEDLDSGVFNFAFQKNVAGGSLGPYLVVDEVTRPYELELTTRVNGEMRQSGNTREMIRRFEEMISYISKFIELLPGDILASGTCAGTALDSSALNKGATKTGESKLDTALALKEGDVVEGIVGNLGTIKNRIGYYTD